MDRAPIAVIVPTLNEARALRECLTRLERFPFEVVVSDGGSDDGTVEIARRLGARVVSGPPGRGVQLNAGAGAATADVLLFLHADTFLPDTAADDVRRALAAGFEGGGFLVRFDDSRGALRLGARLINRRTRWTRVPLGDQAQFCRRDVFEELGGFRDWPILEDLDFGRRLKRRGRLTVLPARVTTSARRFVTRGIPRTIATNWLIWALYFAGVSPRRLSSLYRIVR